MPPYLTRARILIAVAAAVLGLGIGAIAVSPARPASTTHPVAHAPSATASAAPTPSVASLAPTLMAPANPAGVTAAKTSLFGWAFIDRRTGRTAGSANAATALNTVESMIKPGIAADYLRRLAERGKEPSEATLREITLMIIDSNDPIAEKYYRLGGGDAVINRLVKVCGLKKVILRSEYWSWTKMPPNDAAHYGLCLADGRAAGPKWTAWLLDTMTHVRGGVSAQISGSVQGGRWGIIEALPAQLATQTSIKNGWTSYVDGWHVNCLAIHRDWVLAVEVRTYLGLRGAADICKSVARKLLVTAPV